MTAVRDPEQPKRALGLANHVRTANREMKADIGAMDRNTAIRRVISLMDNPDGPHGGMQIGQLLQAIPAFGEVKSARVLTLAGVLSTPLSSTRKVRSLTPRQRVSIAIKLWDLK